MDPNTAQPTEQRSGKNSSIGIPCKRLDTRGQLLFSRYSSEFESKPQGTKGKEVSTCCTPAPSSQDPQGYMSPAGGRYDEDSGPYHNIESPLQTTSNFYPQQQLDWSLLDPCVLFSSTPTSPQESFLHDHFWYQYEHGHDDGEQHASYLFESMSLPVEDMIPGSVPLTNAEYTESSVVPIDNLGQPSSGNSNQIFSSDCSGFPVGAPPIHENAPISVITANSEHDPFQSQFTLATTFIPPSYPQNGLGYIEPNNHPPPLPGPSNPHRPNGFQSHLQGLGYSPTPRSATLTDLSGIPSYPFNGSATGTISAWSPSRSSGHKGGPAKLDSVRKWKDDFLLESRAKGKTYRTIKIEGNFSEAISTLRGRYRQLTKQKEQRLRKPEWSEENIQLLIKAVKMDVDSVKVGTKSNRNISWSTVAEYIAKNGSYAFGNSTCKKKWDEVRQDRSISFE